MRALGLAGSLRLDLSAVVLLADSPPCGWISQTMPIIIIRLIENFYFSWSVCRFLIKRWWCVLQLGQLGTSLKVQFAGISITYLQQEFKKDLWKWKQLLRKLWLHTYTLIFSTQLPLAPLCHQTRGQQQSWWRSCRPWFRWPPLVALEKVKSQRQFQV